jgi:outer membrane protein assembly factor BamB
MKLIRTIFVFTGLSLLLIFSGCSGITLHQAVILSGEDWVMAGGNSVLQYRSKSVISPPFKLLWTYNCDAGFGPSCLAVADGIAFVNTLQGEMHCVDILSGGKIGQLNFLGKEASTTPYVDGNKLVLAFAGDNGRSLVLYDLLEGQSLWEINIGYLQTSPILVNDYIYIGSLNGREYKIRKSSGSIIWSYNTKSQIHSSSALYENKLVFGADNGYIYCLHLDDGSLLWQYKTGESVFAPPMIFNNKVFIGSFDLNYYCLDLDSGSVLWKKNMETKICTGTSLFDSSSVIFGGVDGSLYSINIKDGSIKWSYPTKAVITGTPLSSGKHVFFSSHDWYVYCLNGEDGKEVWKYELDGRGKTSPVIWNKLLFQAADKYVYCFESSTK